MSAEEISSHDARRMWLRAQGLYGPAGRRAGVPGMLRRVGAVQLDTISVLARSHELVAYARLGPVGRARVEDAYWGSPPRAFEYWAHAASIMPIESWPLFALRRRLFREEAREHSDGPVATRKEVLAAIRASGPMTATDLGGAKKGGPWWDWSDAKRAVEWLLWVGEVVCVTRRGFKRVYDLAERAIPADLYAQDPSDEACAAELVAMAARRLGVATRSDLAEYFRIKKSRVGAALEALPLVEVNVRGWEEPAWADPELFEEVSTGRLRGRNRTTLLSPFDSMIWDRARTERLFGFAHRLEAYVPRPKRVHGYFAMPLLHRGRLVGRVDPARRGKTLVALKSSVEPGNGAALGTALAEAASWVGATTVALEKVDPPKEAAAARAVLNSSGL